MKTVVLLSVLVLALIIGAAADKEKDIKKVEAEAEAKKEEECNTVCLGEKLKEPVCKEACALNTRFFKKVWMGAFECSLKCQKKHGFDSPAAKPCDEECKKKYEEKVAELAGSCHEICSKEEKELAAVEKCKKMCTPSLIYKQMQEKKAAEAKH